MNPSPFNVQKRCRNGDMLYHRHDRYIGRSLELYGEFSEAEVQLLTSLLRPGSVVVEAGATTGAPAIPLSRAAGTEGSVTAFEPQRLVFDLLCANLAMNGIENVHAHQRAVGAASGSVTVPQLDPSAEANFGGVALGHCETGESVPVVSIDDLQLPRLDLIKADVEGMEADVIAGAKDSIAGHRPILYLENDRPEKRDKLCEIVRSLGYRIWWHTPPLFQASNFAGNPEDVFEGIASLNILCVPSESDWRPDPALPYLSEQSPQQSVIAEAVAQWQAGNGNAAVELLRKAIAAWPGFALYHYHLGNVYWSDGQGSEAEACFSQACRLDPQIGDIPFQSGVECARAGDFEVAEGCLWLALGFRPEHAPTLTCLGDVLRHLGRVDEGLPLLEEAVRLAPESSEAHANLGAGLCELDRLNEAVTALENARTADPSNAAAANNLGLVYKQQGRLDMARRSLDQAVRTAPDFAEARLNRAMTMLLAGDFCAGLSAL